jgi:hypothetical protein
MSDQLDELIGLVQFGPVTIQRNGVVKWNSGDFVDEPEKRQDDDLMSS